jgi:hypothetical protein
VRGALGGGGAGVLAAVLLAPLLVHAGGGHWQLVPVLAMLGAAVGGWGGALVGGGIAAGTRSGSPRMASVLLGAAGGGLAGAIGHLLVGWTMNELLGHGVTALGGALEGLALGGAVAAGMVLGGWRAIPSRDDPSRAAPTPILAAVLAGAAAAGVIAVLGGRLSGTSLDAIADALKGARILAPLGTYLGEPPALGARGAGPATRLAVSLLEGGFFGGGVAWALGVNRHQRTS